MLGIAAAKAADTGLVVEWVRGDASALPFASERFDLVVSVAALEFVGDRSQVLREAMRVLKPGGRLVLGLLARDSPWGEMYLRDAEERTDSVFVGAHLFTEEELPALLAAPYTLRKGLYCPPDPDLDLEVAERLEGQKQSLHENRAGFFAVRWVKAA
jgi:SAM-dependent methyltransferase